MKRMVEIIVGSVRANAMPATVLWLVAIVLVAGYHFVSGIASALEPVVQWHMTNGWRAAFLTQFFFCGVVPGAFLLTVRSIKTPHPIVKALVQAVWCGGMGIACWWFYGLQCCLFGDGCDVSTLLYKTLVDQFIWTAFIVSPLGALFFVWLGCDFSFAKTRDTVQSGFVRRVVMPNLVANWCVWIPVVVAIYTFPRALQIVVLGIVSSIWVLLSLQIGSITSHSATNARHESQRPMQ